MHQHRHWFSDPIFWLAVIAALPIWALIWIYREVQPDALWVIHNPKIAISVLILWPWAEELVFRGLIQTTLLRSFPITSRLSHANVISSLLFTLTHWLLTPTWLAALVFFPSLLFGALRERHGTITSPTLMHIFYNMGWFFLFPPIGA